VIEIANQVIEETTTEYAVQCEPELLVDCDTLEEAENFSKIFKTPVLERRVYITGWYPRVTG
jgi:hypothetical protein